VYSKIHSKYTDDNEAGQKTAEMTSINCTEKYKFTIKISIKGYSHTI